jgi:hypothetical protein
VDVKLFEQDDELYVLAKGEGRRAKETAMRRKRLANLLRKLRAMRRSLPSLVQLLMRLGAAKAAAARAFHFVQMKVPEEGQEVTRDTFQFRVDKKKLQEAEWRDGHYLLRSNLTAGDPSVLWTRYVQLTQIETVFKSLKSELCIRPRPVTDPTLRPEPDPSQRRPECVSGESAAAAIPSGPESRVLL